MKYIVKIALLLTLSHISLHNYSQDLPPINTFSPKQYGAGNQNWSISQSEKNYIYVANNNGLLEFNGSNWQLYPSPNETIIRSVSVVGEKIYTGCYMEFGYWQRNEFGFLEYTSLSKDLKEPLINDEQFWNIISLENYILFQSLNRVYIYNTINKSFNYIESKTRLSKVYLVDGMIYFQKLSSGLYKIQNGKEVLVFDDPVVTNNIIVNIHKLNDSLLFVTQNKGLFVQSNGTISKWNNANKDVIDAASIYSSIELKDNSIVLGTISHGIIHLSADGEIINQFDQQKGLSNNTILSLFEDKDNNIWLGLDNGINCINLDSQYSIYQDVIGELGTVYASKVFNDVIYLGTNQGLFYKDINSNDGFKSINELKGQVWSLSILDDKLFCGHDKGTFIIEQDKTENIFNIQGTWKIVDVPNNKNLILQGNYLGLHVLEKKGNSWVYKNKIEGFDISSKFFEFLNPNEIIVSHEYKGVFKIKVDESYTQALSVIPEESIEKGLHSSLIKYENNIYYTYIEGVFKYNRSNNRFERDSLLNNVFNKQDFISGQLVVDNDTNKIWSFSKKHISYITSGNLSTIPEINKIHLPDVLRKSKTGYENITHLKDNKFLLGSTDGYLTIDLDRSFKKTFDIGINSVSINEINKRPNKLNLYSVGDFKNKENNIKFNYSVTEFNKYSEIEYTYQLKGLYDNWSPWNTNSSVFFDNLPFGDYTFNVKAKVGDSVSNNTASYSFTINRPWLLSNTMIAFYVLLFVILSTLVHNFYKRYYKKQREKLLLKSKKELELKELENEQQLMYFKNEQLEQDIKSKNRELAISTMSLIKKNEFLNSLKNELKKADPENNLKSVVKLINNNINNTDDWKFFQEAFNNADKDFLKKVKERHPSLTPNDLRLCAYLRLNLSSKEIAPLLNISSRSVEVKRYRLRKKMNLPHESSLTNYILEI